jgi:N-acetylglucosaminyldiphosphoundecaprenol N-acetyl-beta-D-mannosaminyltransferase
MKKNIKNIQKKGRQIGQILGINVNSTSTSLVLARVEKFISDSSKFYILTPNPEIILMAQKNKRLKDAMNAAELAIPDGVGLKLAIPDLPIIKGRELFSGLIALAVKKNWKVFLLGGLDSEAELVSKRFKIQDSRFKIQTFRGPRLDNNAEPISEADRKLQKEAIDRINKFAPELLFVAFGNPRQEIWVHENYSKLNIGGAMAVGGAFRYLAGQASLPPRWMSGIGLEWLWRLITEPRRVGRIFRAVIVFPLKVFLSKFN